MKLDDCFERIYVINLPYKRDRRMRLIDHLSKRSIINVSSIRWETAISGDLCGSPRWFEAGNGAWGCLQSHLRIVQNAAMDRISSYCVLEDDVVFHERGSELLSQVMSELPSDWGQLYLGGQHLDHPRPLSSESLLAECTNVNRTHAYALNSNAFNKFQQHIIHAPDYISRGPWHIDHQLGIAHERSDWKVYAPLWWIAGQDEGPSNISGRINPVMWWHPGIYSTSLPFIHVSPTIASNLTPEIRKFLHFGNNCKPDTCEDIGLDACVGSIDRLREWLKMIAVEAIGLGVMPAISHPRISKSAVKKAWAGGLCDASANLDELCRYPFNGLFDHPAVKCSTSLTIAGSSAA